MDPANNSALRIVPLGRASLAGDDVTVQPNSQNQGLHNSGLDMTIDMVIASIEQLLRKELSLMNMLDIWSLGCKETIQTLTAHLPELTNKAPPTMPILSWGIFTSSRIYVTMVGMNTNLSQTPLEDRSPLGIHNVTNSTVENSREFSRFYAKASLETRENVVLENINDRQRQFFAPYNFNRALRAFQPSQREEQRMGPYRGLSMPTKNNERRKEITRLIHYHDSEQPLHPTPSLPLQQLNGEYFEPQVVPNSYHQMLQAIANNRQIPHSTQTSYLQPQVPYSPFGAIDEILNARRPGQKTFEPSMMISEGRTLDWTRNVSLNPNMRTRTQSCCGEGTRKSNQDDTIPEFLSCAIWISAIPSKATHYDVLHAIHLQGTGRVYSSFLNTVGEGHSKKSAKIIFTTAEATRLIIDQANSSDGLRICGQKVSVQYNRHRCPAHYSLNQSRAIRVSGPPDLVNFQALLYFWSKSVTLDVLDVRNVGSSPRRNVIDWFFGSIVGQSVGATLSIKMERGLRERGVRVSYRSDPCER